MGLFHAEAAAAPLAIPAFIASYAWVSLSNGLQDFGGALLVAVSVIGAYAAQGAAKDAA